MDTVSSSSTETLSTDEDERREPVLNMFRNIHICQPVNVVLRIYTDTHICIYIRPNRNFVHAVKNWDLFFDRCNEELLTISVTMTCEDDLCACPRSMQCKCSLYCMHADLCVCEFDFNLM